MNSQSLQFKAELFKALSNPLRLRIIDQLKGGPKTVGELNAKLQAEPTNLSQQLAVLRAKNILVAEKRGINMIYRCKDQEIFSVIESAQRLFTNHLSDLKGLIESQAQSSESDT